MAKLLPESNINDFYESQEYLHLPANILEVYSKIESNKDDFHTGMIMVQKSIEANRACNEAIIFTYGCSGDGKSESLNNLFGFPIIKVYNKQISDTKIVTEYVAELTSTAWKVRNLKLVFIDVPGSDDTRGIDQNATNLATIDRFIQLHPHLGNSNRQHKCYPNIILVAINAGQKRMEGRVASMLDSLKCLNIIDFHHPNVIIVLTHIMNLPIKIFEEKLAELIEFTRRLVISHLGINAPIVYLENRPNDYFIDKIGDMFKLPDGILQPKNLLDEMINQMEHYEDEIGAEAIRIYFDSRGENKPKIRGTMEQHNITNADFNKWQRIVIQKAKALIKNDVTALLEDKEKMGKKKPSLVPLMFALNRANFTKIEDLEGKDLNEINAKLSMFHTLSGFEKNTLIDVFKVQPIVYPILLESLFKGYRISDGNYLENNIFDIPVSMHISSGVLVPICVDVCDVNQFTVDCIEDTSVVPEVSQANQIELRSFIFTITQFKTRVKLIFDEHLSELIQDEFKRDVNKLPAFQGNPSFNEVHQVYEEFVEKYGNFIKSSCSGGGIIQGIYPMQFRTNEYRRERVKIMEMVKAKIRGYINRLPNKEEGVAQLSGLESDGTQRACMLDGLKACNIQFRGGIPPLCTCLAELNSMVFNDWVLSLAKHLVIIEPRSNIIEEMRSMPDIVRLIGEIDRAEQINQAFNNLYNGPSVFIQPQMEELTLTNSYRSRYIIDTSQRRTNTPRTAEIDPKIFNPIPLPTPPEDPLTRSNIVRQLIRARYGFPPQARVLRKRANNEAEEVHISEIEVGDKVLCVTFGNRFNFSRVIKKDVDNIDQRYQIIHHRSGKLTIGSNNIILAFKMKLNTEAKKLKIDDRIYFISKQENNLVKCCHIHKIERTRAEGNVRLRIEDSVYDYNMIVDGIACGTEEGCFPGNALITLKGGNQIPISHLSLGQSVLSVDMKTNKLLYTKVYLWAHRQPHTVATFLRIVYQGGAVITLTHNHLLPMKTAAAEHCTRPKMLPASRLKVGDIIYTTTATSSNMRATPARVLFISTCTQTGYYAPLTNNSVIVVDGVVASVFSLPASPSSSLLAEQGKLTKHLRLHTVAHHLFTPLRVASKLGLSHSLNKQVDNWTGMHRYCTVLLKIFKNLYWQ